MRHAQRLGIVLFALLFCLAAPLTGLAQGISEPTAAQEQEIQEAMERGEGYQDRLDECRRQEQEARDAGNADLADAWREAAEAWERAIAANRELVITLVDIYYNIQAPPGTTISYDPDSTDYGYTTGNKNNKRVFICPNAFDDGADLVASTKLHELRHAWQIHWCWSSHDGYWDNCTFWDHLAEWDSYTEEEKAYDAGITDGMPEEEKELIRRRIREHRRAMWRRLFGGWLIDLIHVRPGNPFHVPLVVENFTSQPVTAQVFVNDAHGWLINPPTVPPINLLPEQEQIIVFDVQTPPTATPGMTNGLTLYVNSGGVVSSDTAFIVVDPSIKIKGPALTPAGDRGMSIPIEIVALSLSSAPVTATITVASQRGWTVQPSSATVVIPPVAVANIITTITLPINAPANAVDLVTVRANVQGDPLDGDQTAIPVKVNERDVGPLSITTPRTLPLGGTFRPNLWVMNSGDFIQSFFDVFVEVELPNRTGSMGVNAIVTSGSVRVDNLAPGESREVTFPPIRLDEPGSYTLRVYTNLGGDADPGNNLLTAPLEVIYEPLVASASRTVAPWFWGEPTTVTVQVAAAAAGTSVAITETLPSGWQLVSALDGGVQTAPGSLRWEVQPWTTAGATVRYTAAYPTWPRIPTATFAGGLVSDIGGTTTPIPNTTIKHAGVVILQQGVWPDATYAGTQDAHVLVNQVNNNTGAHDFIEEGTWDGGTGDHKKIFIKFNLAGVLLSAADVTSAQLLLFYDFQRRAGIASNAHAIYAQKVLKAWNEGARTGVDGQAGVDSEVTWNAARHNQQAWEIAGAMGATDIGPLFAHPGSAAFGTVEDVWVALNVTDDVQEFLAAPAGNQGWKIGQDRVRGVPDNDPRNPYVQGAYDFASSENATAGRRPMLIIWPSTAVPVEVSRFMLY